MYKMQDFACRIVEFQNFFTKAWPLRQGLAGNRNSVQRMELTQFCCANAVEMFTNE